MMAMIPESVLIYDYILMPDSESDFPYLLWAESMRKGY